jgi:hypothetical protein
MDDVRALINPPQSVSAAPKIASLWRRQYGDVPDNYWAAVERFRVQSHAPHPPSNDELQAAFRALRTAMQVDATEFLSAYDATSALCSSTGGQPIAVREMECLSGAHQIGCNRYVTGNLNLAIDHAKHEERTVQGLVNSL